MVFDRPFLPTSNRLDKALLQEEILLHQRKKTFRQDFDAHVNEKRKKSQHRQKVLIVANRLPATLKRDENGDWQFQKSSGGLVSGLQAAKENTVYDMMWVGWPGAEIPEEDQESVLRQARQQDCYPVFLSQELISQYYNGFANNVLWPLFHYITPPLDHGVNESTSAQWEAYQIGNDRFTEAILEVYEDDDYVWVHDYHLMLVPRMLRERRPNANIGWFLHTPFPSAEVYRMLPMRQEILRGLLSANLLAFHVYDYMRHFLSSCVQLTSLENSPHGVDATPLGGAYVRCATVPIGIQPELFTEMLDLPEVKDFVASYEEQYEGQKVILGIDRLDYMKGIPHKLMAFDKFLEDHPEMVGKCVLVQLAVPSRGDVPEYQRLKRQVHELVGQICGRHSTLQSGPPVIYLDQAISQQELTALYYVADVALITSLRDGMNLVSYEFVACQRDKHGVLILSEFAGAAQSLGAGSIRINPWNLQETANAIHEALVMPDDLRKDLHSYAFTYIHKHTAKKWFDTFIESLREAAAESEEVSAEIPPLLPYEELLTEWSASTKRLLVFDLLDCLVPAKSSRNMPMKLYQSLIVLPAHIAQCLQTIGSSPDTTIIVTTTHKRNVLERLLGHLPIILAPEDGCIYRRPGGEWQNVVEESEIQDTEEWMTGVQDVLEFFQERTPGSYTERQEFSLKWYYDDIQADFGSAQAREVLIHLWAGPLANSEAEVIVGSRAITVRPHACSRSTCLGRLIRQELGAGLQKVDLAICMASVAFRDEDVYQIIEDLLTNDDPPSNSVTRQSSRSTSLDPILPEEDTDGLAQQPAGKVLDSIEENPSPHHPSPRHPSHGFASPNSSSSASSPFHTPPHSPNSAPMPAEDELPPPYDWTPIAQRMKFVGLEGLPASVVVKEVAEGENTDEGDPIPEAQSADPESMSNVSYFAVCVGMKVSKAKYSLPNPYHVQNLIRAMAARCNAQPSSESDPGGTNNTLEPGDSGGRAIFMGPDGEMMGGENDGEPYTAVQK